MASKQTSGGQSKAAAKTQKQQAASESAKTEQAETAQAEAEKDETERAEAADQGTAQAQGESAENGAPEPSSTGGEVRVSLSVRKGSRWRAGVKIGRDAQEHQVSEAQLAILEADPKVRVKRL